MKVASGGAFAAMWLACSSTIILSISAVDCCCSAVRPADATKSEAAAAIRERIITLRLVGRKPPLVSDRLPPIPDARDKHPP